MLKKDKRERYREFMRNSDTVKLTLGEEFRTGCGNTLRLIRVTRKGFNLLWVEGHRTVLPKHIYAMGWSNREIPNKVKTFKFRLSKWVITHYLSSKINKEES